MQRPTCTGIRVRSPADAHIIFHAVSLNILPIISRRLDSDERRSISSGCVFVWEERGPNTEATGLGIERWTDSIRWGPSRVRDEFLFYHEREPAQMDIEMISSDSGSISPIHDHGFLRDNLIKQTYSVFVETPRGRRKWHLIAYFTQRSLDYLRTIDEIPELAAIHVPPGTYTSVFSDKLKVAKQRHNERLIAPTRPAFGRFAPLASPENVSPHPRYPVDEKMLASLPPELSFEFSKSHATISGVQTNNSISEKTSGIVSSMEFDKYTKLKQVAFLAAGTVVGCIVGGIAIPAGVGAILGLPGFSAIGPAPGSLAAAWQASIRDVASESSLVIIQAMAMAAVPPVAVVVGGIVIGLVTGLSIWGLIRYIKMHRAQNIGATEKV